ncbi:hypothetical protein [Streptomyces sp. NBC_00470]|uniref:hypothetical protein n=1 Tax=Streptomyces sp. NBC_00470 TaxID=2975753 RepID=UPI002F91A14E
MTTAVTATAATMTVIGRGYVSVHVTPGHLNDAAREAFTEGQCHALALALNEATGWPITAILTADSCRQDDPLCNRADDDHCACRIGHLVVTRPDGTHLDITGAHTPGTVPDCHGAPSRAMTAEDWQALRTARAWRAPDLRAARTFVAPLLASLA